MYLMLPVVFDALIILDRGHTIFSILLISSTHSEEIINTTTPT
jgi:hypothetical protein